MLNRLSYKLVVAVAAALLTVMVAGFILLNHQLIRSAEYDILQSYSREIQQIGDNLDTYTAGLEDTLLSLLCDTRLQESINRPLMDETLENQLSEIRTLREVVNYVEGNRQVDRVRLYLSDEKMLTREHVNFFSHTDANTWKWKAKRCLCTGWESTGCKRPMWMMYMSRSACDTARTF